MRRIWRSALVVLIEKTPDYRYFIVLSIVLLVLLLTSCSKKPDSQLFDVSDPLHYTGQRPVAPYTTTVAPTGHTIIAKFTAANGEIGFITKGFANSFPDPRVTIESELIGKATVQHVHP